MITLVPWGDVGIYYNNNDEELYLQRLDGSLKQLTGGGGGYQFFYQSTPPTPSPDEAGAVWIDSDTDVQYVRIYNGTSYVWLQLNTDRLRTTAISTSSALANFDYDYYGVTYTGGICNVTLPLATGGSDDGLCIVIADETGSVSASGRGIVVTGSGGQTINGDSSITMQLDYISLTFMFRNGIWKTI